MSSDITKQKESTKLFLNTIEHDLDHTKSLMIVEGVGLVLYLCC